MDQQSSSNDRVELTSLINTSTQRSSLQTTDRRNSATSSSRTFSPVAFFHDGVIMNEIDWHNKIMAAERRARAIATAPRRKRYDDDNDDEEDDTGQKNSLFDFIKTSAVPIPIPAETQHTHSLPQTQVGTSLIPTFRIDPPSQDDCGQFDYTFNRNSRLNRYSSVILPSKSKN